MENSVRPQYNKATFFVCCPSNRNYFTKSVLRTPANLLAVYRSMQTFCTLFNHSLKEVVLWLQGTTVAYIVICNYIIFGHFHAIESSHILFVAFLSVSTTIIWFFCLNTMSICYWITRKTHATWVERSSNTRTENWWDELVDF